MTKKFLISMFLSLVVPTGLFAQDVNATPPPDIDNYVAQVLKTFDVPGMSISIVKDGSMILAKGYGTKNINDPAPVDEKTLFGIASNSKAFTATALAMLVEEGKIGWDKPVIDYLPWFRMSDPYVTNEITVRDLLVHHSGLGLGAGDLLQFPPSTYDRREIVRKLRFIPLETSFRSNFAYDNILYLAAGELIEAASGMTWEDFVKKNIFDRIGMGSSIDNISLLPDQRNFATPHAEIDGKLQIVQPDTFKVTDPAGGINSNATDMAKWMIVQLDSGRAENGTILFTPASTSQLWKLVTPIDISKAPDYLAPLQHNFFGYGLGFFLSDYRGYKSVSHTGGLNGYVSKVTLIPELKLGVTVLTNQESDGAFSAVTYHILDYYMHAPAFDWIGGYKRLMDSTETKEKDIENSQASSRVSISHPSLPLERYAGTYNDPWYGDVSISKENDRLVIRFSHSPALVGDLQHWQYDTFVARWRDRELRADAFVIFDLDERGSIDRVRMKAFSPATDFSYDFQDLLLKPVGGIKTDR